MPRLHVTKLTSIGAVEDGDNPEAEILFWKRAISTPEPEPADAASKRRRLRALRARIQRQNPGLNPADVAAEAARLRPDLVTKRDPAAAIEKVLDGRDARLAALNDQLDTVETLERERDMTRPAEIGPEGTVRGEVDRLASELVNKGEADNLTQARPMIWKSRPDLVDASRAVSEDVYHRRRGGKPEDSPGVAGEVYKAVSEWALEMTGVPEHWTKSTAAIRAEIWRSPRGRLLRELYTDANTHGDKVQKADRHTEARQILKALQDDPSAYIVG